ncbi:MAG: FecR family protein [Patescibacteria group bacterium]
MQFRISYGIVFSIFGMMIIAAALALWFGMFRAAPQELAETPHAVITEVRGNVEITRAGTVKEVTSGMEVLSGDVLTTAEASAAAVTFFESSRVALDANSSLRIDEAMIDAAAPQRQNVILTLTSGRVWSRILKLLDAESSYGVAYNGVVSGVRGTAFVVTGKDMTAVIDVFDGIIGVSGKTFGNISEGFSATINTAQPPATVNEVLSPMSDVIRNDSWIQEQLDDDAVFSKHVIDIRNALGVVDAVAEYREVQKAADSGVLRDPGVDYSDYERLTVLSPSQQYVLFAATPLQLQALAHFTRTKGEETRDVTKLATWTVSHPDRATVQNGVVTLVPFVSGMTSNDANSAPLNVTPGVADNTVEIVARWHDGTHEHSAAVTVLLAN